LYSCAHLQETEDGAIGVACQWDGKGRREGKKWDGTEEIID